MHILTTAIAAAVAAALLLTVSSASRRWVWRVLAVVGFGAFLLVVAIWAPDYRDNAVNGYALGAVLLGIVLYGPSLIRRWRKTN